MPAPVRHPAEPEEPDSADPTWIHNHVDGPTTDVRCQRVRAQLRAHADTNVYVKILMPISTNR